MTQWVIWTTYYIAHKRGWHRLARRMLRWSATRLKKARVLAMLCSGVPNSIEFTSYRRNVAQVLEDDTPTTSPDTAL